MTCPAQECLVPGLATSLEIMLHDYMRCFSFVVTIAAIFMLPANPAAAEPLQPTGKWTVDFGNDRCVAYRSFGRSDDPVLLLLKPSPVGDVMQLQVAEKGINRPGIQDKASITLGADQPFSILQLQYGSNKQSIRMVNLTKYQVERLSAATTLKWSERGKQYDLALGPMNKLIETIDKCQDMLADHWNATLTKRMTLKEAPTLEGSVLSLFSTNDYPWDAVRKGQAGLAHVVMLIDEKGKMADCTLIATSGIAVLDAQTCIVLRTRGKFKPAIDADGKPARGTLHQRVNWEMP